jgi:small subunit ribosomal protein S15
MITKEKTVELTAQFGGSDKNTGLPEVQIAIMTERIKNLTSHFGDHKADHHSKRGLMKLIGRRRRLLRYIQGKDEVKYQETIKALGLRK